MYPFPILRLLNWLRLRNDVLTCMPAARTYVWGNDLGRPTLGKCFVCGTLIYYEKQNWVFRRKKCISCPCPDCGET